MQAQLEESQQRVANSQAINGALQQRQLALQQQLTDTRLLASTDPATATAPQCCEHSEVVLHFRSNSQVIEPHYHEALLRFVAQSAASPGRVIAITGFADRRGDAAENLFLSQRRVEAVVQKLREMGLSGATFQTVAFGEREPVSGTEGVESNFFDRRVVLRLSEENQSLLSSAGH
jgi:outer membrane protein OmpA-like peptidoglycan-associated protein